MRLTVITEADGEVAAVQEGYASEAPKDAEYAVIVAGEGQTAHEVEVDLPESIGELAPEELLRTVAAHLAR
ncbi:hypothetical protein ABT354_22770 [Streptomyces sp. NPDC000594]|uniref:hypothetical protein n=1 Tax=Streptomyces sp. NPDC000594 TaxID=3154261 RepID=UPI00333296E3